METKKKPTGRPTRYSPELAEEVLLAISCSSKGLDHICAEHEHFPDPTTLYRWRLFEAGFSQKYAEAKKMQSEVYADSTIDICSYIPYYTDKEGTQKVDAGYVAWQRLNVSTRQWHASKLSPKVYGDSKQIDDLSVAQERLHDELIKLRAELDEKNKREY